MRYVAGLAVAVSLAGSGCTTDDNGGPNVQPGNKDGGPTGGKGGTGPGGMGGTGPGGQGGGGVTDAPVGDDSGKCLGAGGKPLGNACGCSAECASGFCADGVCCNTACSGACVSCSQPETMGECTVLKLGASDPHHQCKTEDPKTCGQDGTCNGLGGCAKHKPGTNCGPGGCVMGGGLMPASSCDGNGTCLPGSAITCNPSICENGSCKVVCTSNADCVAPRTCNNGSCGPRPLGVQCDNNAQCKSGFCADGVCCDNACAGKCTYCALPTSLGRCVPVGANAPDPRVAAGVKDAARICVDQGSATCGTTGRCDGSGGCQIYPDGTVCKNQTCNATNNRVTPASTCKAAACVTVAARSCGAFKCNANRCGTSCLTDNDCVAPNSCVNGLCGKLPLGGPCSTDAVCGSGFCTQGVCCNVRCNGVCQQCNEPASMGICGPVAAGGMDPSNTCKDMGKPSCGTDGVCDGLGACRKYINTTVCQDAKCASGQLTATATCDGNGMCKVPPAKSCGGFACVTGQAACLASCTTDAQCVPGVPCLAGKCGQSAAGGPCQDGTDCKSGLVCSKNRVCCTTACEGPCQTCDTGTCGSIGAGLPPPGGGCAKDPTNPICGNTGNCNGAGACALGAAAGTPCNGNCSADNRTIDSCAAGLCKAGTAMSCVPKICRGTGVNAKCIDCTADGDCPTGQLCVGGSCQAPKTCSGSSACDKCGTLTCNPRTGMFGPPCTGQGDCNPGDPPMACNGGGMKTCLMNCKFTDCNCAGRVCGTCIPGAECCVNGDCTGATNSCDGGHHCVCSGKVCSGVCVAGAQCCADADCTGMTNKCDLSTHQCTCNGKVCGGTCLGGADCCVPGDCPAPDMCNTNTCVSNSCGHASVNCNDSNACTTDSCDPATGCKHTAVDCDDNNACTTDTCDLATGCKHTSISCNDNNACTADSCDPGSGCKNDAITCNDNNVCTTDTCNPMSGCQSQTTMNCNDNNACTADSCDPVMGCQNTAINCNDNNACTMDTCDTSTGCKHDTISCNDSNACTTDSCDPGSGCTHGAVNCDDNDACTVELACDPGSGCQRMTRDCADADPCTVDSCDPATGCKHTPMTCTGGKVCQAGSCVCTGATPNDCSGTCVDLQTDHDHCNDCNTACTAGQTCVGGACVP